MRRRHLGGVAGGLVAAWLLVPTTAAGQAAPADSAVSEPETAAGPRAATDAWGQERNFGLAAVEVWMGNYIPWLVNEFLPSRAELKISQLSPRSWWRNIQEGWEWDDNEFSVNYFAHPFQGNIYYNAGRSNGYGYWASLLFATAGSFNWECCGETHFMSINDWINTSLGGAAVGEVLYRSSSMILDNQARGRERALRESAAFLLNPSRGFTRLVTGNARKVYANPSDSRDRVPDQLDVAVWAGLRRAQSFRSARGGELDEKYPSHGFLNVALTSGDLFSLERQKPFDYFRASAHLNFIRGRAIAELRVRGNLWHRDLTDSRRTTSKLVLLQYFDYENNPAFEKGGQGVSIRYMREDRIRERSELEWYVAGGWTILGGVRSELALLSDVAGIRERLREYDFGTGPSVQAGATLRYRGRKLLAADYAGQFLKTLNGSSGQDFGSHHVTHSLRLYAATPDLYRGIGAGTEVEFFRRQSVFEYADVGLVRQRAAQWYFFLTWHPFDTWSFAP